MRGNLGVSNQISLAMLLAPLQMEAWGGVHQLSSGGSQYNRCSCGSGLAYGLQRHCLKDAVQAGEAPQHSMMDYGMASVYSWVLELGALAHC